jgi:DHA1 family bicyclomycin/chloramphenicol resistance-like MFS transporter
MAPPPSLGRDALLTALVAFTALTVDIVLPAMPAIARELGARPAEGQLVIGVFVFSYAVCQLVYGPLSDRFGRRPVLLVGVSLYVVASILCLLAATMTELLLGRVAQAVGACAGPVLARAVVRDLHGRDGAARMLAQIGMVMGFIPGVAPIVGGLVTDAFGWRAVFVLLAAFAAVTLAGVWFLLPETNRHKNPEATRPGRLLATYASLARNGPFLGYALACTGCFAAMFSFHSLAPFVVIERYGLTPRAFSLWFLGLVAGFVVGSVLSHRYAHRLGLDRAILIGLAVVVAAAAGAFALERAGIHAVLAIVGPTAAMMLGFGLVFPNAMAGAIAPFPTAAGAASALLGFVTSAGGALAATVASRFHDGSPRAMVTAMILAALLGTLAYLGLVWRRRAPAPAPTPAAPAP